MKRVLAGLGAACVFAVCIVGIVLATHLLHQQAAAREFTAAGPANLAREEASARLEGIPLTAGQLQQPLPPPSQNAAPLYVKLTKLLHDKPLGLPKYAEGMDAFHTYTPQQIASVRKTLAARRDVMTLVHQAADRPQCVFVRQWGRGPDLELPEYQKVREAARLIKTESYLLARDGLYPEAVANQTRGFRVAEHAASDHVLLAYLVGNADESITLSGMQSILALAGPNAAVDADVRQEVDAKRSRLSLRAAMAGETAFDCAVFPQMHSAEGRGVEAALSAAGFPSEISRSVKALGPDQRHLHFLIDAWQADFLGRMRPLVVACGQPPPLRRAGFVSVNEKLKRDGEGADGMLYVFSSILMPVFSDIDQNDTRIKAREAVTLAAAALLAEKAKTGAYPNTLPSGFPDPYTGKPLLYRREGGGFVVYSAGPTGRFDGGKPGAKVPGQESLFRYPAVPVPN